MRQVLTSVREATNNPEPRRRTIPPVGPEYFDAALLHADGQCNYVGSNGLRCKTATKQSKNLSDKKTKGSDKNMKKSLAELPRNSGDQTPQEHSRNALSMGAAVNLSTYPASNGMFRPTSGLTEGTGMRMKEAVWRLLEARRRIVHDV